jgi:GxxExxY protein
MNHGEHGEKMDIWDHSRYPGIIQCDDALIDKVLTAATTLHRELGPGLLESIYEVALMMELGEAGIGARKQVGVPIIYRGQNLGIGFRADIIVCDCLLLELKAVDALNDVHLAQIMTYLKLLRFKRGFLLNFNVKLLKHGIKRVSM